MAVLSSQWAKLTKGSVRLTRHPNRERILILHRSTQHWSWSSGLLNNCFIELNCVWRGSWPDGTEMVLEVTCSVNPLSTIHLFCQPAQYHKFALSTRSVPYICSVNPLSNIHLFCQPAQYHTFVLSTRSVPYICSVNPLSTIHLFCQPAQYYTFLLSIRSIPYICSVKPLGTIHLFCQPAQ